MATSHATTAAAAGLSNGGKVFFSSLCAATFGLGCWQSNRYFEKVDLVARRTADLAKAPVELTSNESEKEDVGGHRRVLVSGQFRHDREVLVGLRGPPPGAISNSGPNSGRNPGGMSSSPQGYFVVTPLERVNDMGTVLVNRGWVPMQYVKQHAEWERPLQTVHIVGVVSKTEQPRFLSPMHDRKESRQLLWFDRSAIEEKTNTVGLSPLYLMETASENSRVTFPVKPNKDSVGEFKVMPSTHAGYAATWFGLSGAGMFMTRKLMTRGRA